MSDLFGFWTHSSQFKKLLFVSRGQFPGAHRVDMKKKQQQERTAASARQILHIKKNNDWQWREDTARVQRKEKAIHTGAKTKPATIAWENGIANANNTSTHKITDTAVWEIILEQ